MAELGNLTFFHSMMTKMEDSRDRMVKMKQAKQDREDKRTLTDLSIKKAKLELETKTRSGEINRFISTALEQDIKDREKANKANVKVEDNIFEDAATKEKNRMNNLIGTLGQGIKESQGDETTALGASIPGGDVGSNISRISDRFEEMGLTITGDTKSGFGAGIAKPLKPTEKIAAKKQKLSESFARGDSSVKDLALSGFEEDEIRELLEAKQLGSLEFDPQTGERLSMVEKFGGDRIENADGTFSTERTIGIEVDGRNVNIPTIVNGKQLTKDQAVQEFLKGNNPAVGDFGTREEADKAAIQRSTDIGKANQAIRGAETEAEARKLTSEPVATEYDPVTGQPTKVVNLSVKKAEAELKALTEISKQVEAKRQKDKLASEMDLRNAALKINNTLDAFLDVSERTMQLTGVGPGILSGTISNVLGRTKTNQFFSGFRGGLTEYAAAVGRIAIPGARAVRLVNLFKGTAPSEFDTIESAIFTSALSFKNGLGTDMSRNPSAYLFPELSDKDALQTYNELNRFEKLELDKQLNEQLENFQSEYTDGAFKIVFDRNPALLNKDTRLKFEQEKEEQSGIVESFGLNPDEFELVE